MTHPKWLMLVIAACVCGFLAWYLATPRRTFGAVGTIVLQSSKTFDVPLAQTGKVLDFAAHQTGLYFLQSSNEGGFSEVIHLDLNGLATKRIPLPILAKTFHGRVSINNAGEVAVLRIRNGQPKSELCVYDSQGSPVSQLQFEERLDNVTFQARTLLAINTETVYAADPQQDGGGIRNVANFSTPLSFPLYNFQLPSADMLSIELHEGRIRRGSAPPIIADEPNDAEWSMPTYAKDMNASRFFDAAFDETGRLYAAIAGMKLSEGIRLVELDHQGHILQRFLLRIPGVEQQPKPSDHHFPMFHPRYIRITGSSLFVSAIQGGRIVRYDLATTR
jgi:hypothetical protein